MSYTLVKNAMKDDRTRLGYDRLAEKTFGLSFSGWYESGHFDGSHIPYTIFDGDKAVANISVNLMDVCFGGQIKIYIQLGTVMTDPDYRGQGLQKILFDEIVKDFEGKYDCMLLFANKKVLEFYPKLGFEKERYYDFSATIPAADFEIRKLDMANAEDVAFFRKLYDMGNPYSALEVKNGFALEMFYCGGPYADNVFYIPQYNVAVVAEEDGNSIICLDILGEKITGIKEIMSAFGKEKLIMGFTPADCGGFAVKENTDDDTTLFILKGNENIFSKNQLLFPMIAHT